MNELERELAELIVAELNLEDVDPKAVSADTRLYEEGFGLDSIDILEIALLISKKYGFELRSDNPDNQKIFATSARSPRTSPRIARDNARRQRRQPLSCK